MITKTQLIKEAPQYQGTTSTIVKDIFKVIKQNITEKEQKTYYLPEELDLNKMFYDNGHRTSVNVELTIKRSTDMKEPFLVDAMYVPEEEIIEIIIQLNPFEEPKSYAPLYQYLMEYVRHELEHFDQEYKGTLPNAEEGMDTMEYYSQPHEVQAQGAGLNLSAKKIKQGYKKVVEDSIELTKQRHGLSDEEGNDLYNLLVNDIEERYGKKDLQESIDFNLLYKIANRYVNKTNVEKVTLTDNGEIVIKITAQNLHPPHIIPIPIPGDPQYLINYLNSYLIPLRKIIDEDTHLYSLSSNEANMVWGYYKVGLKDKITHTLNPHIPLQYPLLTEEEYNRENNEKIAASMNKYFNPPAHEGICEIKVYVSDVTTYTQPIRITIVFDKDTWLKGLGDSIIDRRHHEANPKVVAFRQYVRDEAKKLFSAEMWDIGTAFADCEKDSSVLYEWGGLGYDISKPDSHDAMLKYLLDNTKIDYEEGLIEFPFEPSKNSSDTTRIYILNSMATSPSPLFYLRPSESFFDHVRVGGLNEYDTINLWLEYRNIIRNELNADTRFPFTFLTGSIITEQTESFTPKSKTVFENENYKVFVPLNKESFCHYAKNTTWCDEGKRISPLIKLIPTYGTPYFIKPHKEDTIYFMYDNSKVPLLREKGNYWPNIYNPDSNTTELRKFLSDKPDLIEFFGVDYNFSQRMKHDMPFTPEEILSWKTAEPLNEIVSKLIANENVEENKELLVDFLGKFELSRQYYSSNIPDSEAEVEISDDGITLLMQTDTFISKVLCLGEEDTYYFDRAFELHGDDYEEMDHDELNYMACWFTKDVLDKINEVRALYGEDHKTMCSDYEDGEMNKFFMDHFPNEWDKSQNDLMSALGYAIGGFRREEMHKTLMEDIQINFDVGQVVSIWMPWIHLLYFINNQEMEVLSDIFSECISPIDYGLSDMWHDSWDWSKGGEEDMDYEMEQFLEKIEDEDDEEIGKISMTVRRQRMDNFKHITQQLGFSPTTSYGSNNLLNVLQPFEGGQIVLLEQYDVITDKVYIIIREKGTYRGGKRYYIDLEDLSDYVLSPTLFSDDDS